MPQSVQDLLGEAAESLTRKLSPRTREEYAKCLRHYQGWCVEMGVGRPFPANLPVVLAYVQAHRPLLQSRRCSISTLNSRLAAIADEQRKVGGLPVTSAPEIRGLIKVLRREVGKAEVPKDPLTRGQLDGLGELWAGRVLTNRQSQARAIVLLGFALATRRSNLVAFNLSDVRFEERGVVAFLERSKTDQEARGSELAAEVVGGPLCPVAALSEWVSRLPLDRDGPLFRTVDVHDTILDQRLSDRAVSRIVKRAAAAVGADEARFGGHSLRSGYATEAALLGWDASRIAQQTQHASLDSLRKNIRRAHLWQHNASGALLQPK